MAACLWMGQIYITRKCFEQDMVFFFYAVPLSHGACLWMGQIDSTRKCFEQEMVDGEWTCHEGYDNGLLLE
jgi:hypothetical protein